MVDSTSTSARVSTCSRLSLRSVTRGCQKRRLNGGCVFAFEHTESEFSIVDDQGAVLRDVDRRAHKQTDFGQRDTLMDFGSMFGKHTNCMIVGGYHSSTSTHLSAHQKQQWKQQHSPSTYHRSILYFATALSHALSKLSSTFSTFPSTSFLISSFNSTNSLLSIFVTPVALASSPTKAGLSNSKLLL